MMDYSIPSRERLQTLVDKCLNGEKDTWIRNFPLWEIETIKAEDHLVLKFTCLNTIYNARGMFKILLAAFPYRLSYPLEMANIDMRRIYIKYRFPLVLKSTPGPKPQGLIDFHLKIQQKQMISLNQFHEDSGKSINHVIRDAIALYLEMMGY